MKNFKGYLSMPYPTPDSLRNLHPNSRVLFIGSGSSTAHLIKYKDQLRNHFDVIIVANLSILDFDDVADYWISKEGRPHNLVQKVFTDRKYQTDLTYLIYYATIKLFPRDIKIIKFRKGNYEKEGKLDLTLYHQKYQNNSRNGTAEGLYDMQHPKGPQPARFGTVALQALHLACILGGREIYFVGVDLMFKGEHDHYYEGSPYREAIKPLDNLKIVEVEHQGKQVKTLLAFQRSADFLDEIITKKCRPKGIRVYDFSDGLLSVPKKLNIDEFFKGVE